MLKVLGCIAFEHDRRLIALSAVICVLGCFTTATLMARAGAARAGADRAGARRWLAFAAMVFGSSIWALHFVAMLAFIPAHRMSHDASLTAWSAVVAMAGTLAALLIGHTALPRAARAGLGGCLLGLAVTGMHYLGVAAMSAAGVLSVDPAFVAASIGIAILLSIVALARATALDRVARRVEVSAWLALAICGLHFTGMAAVTLAPGAGDDTGAGALGPTVLAMVVAGVSIIILMASLAATMVEQHISRRTLQELGRMRLMSNLAQEVLLIHRDGTLLEVNSAGERLFQTSADTIVGRPLLSLFTAESTPALIRRDRCVASERRPEEMEVEALDGRRIPVELSCQLIAYLGRPATVVALRDLTDRKRDEARIRHLARHDALTGLPNRHTLLERLGIGLDMAAHQRGTLAVIYIDLDRFKPVNDLHGHAAGDAVLIQASKRMLAEIQPADTLARIGGDEFVMILATELGAEQASATATRIIEAMGRPFDIDGQRIEIGASIGIALYPDDGANADTLMRAADAAMYRVKEEGRGTLRFYEASMNAQLQARLQLEQELAGAIDRDELILHYQPIVNGATGELETFEALIRWNNPRRGMIPPVEFIPLAEQTGLISQIGRWVIETAVREAAAWNQPWRVAVNVSPRQFHHSDVCDVVGNAIRTNGLDPRRLVIEVTEGILIDDTAKAVATLNQLRDLGVRIALDDFGTGYSSLSYLQLFKFDKFKIDKSFVKKLGESGDALTLTRTIVNLGHNLGLQVTAEGVETPAQLAILQTLGCDQIQGYLVGRPAPVEAFSLHDRVRTINLFRTRSCTIFGLNSQEQSNAALQHIRLVRPG